VVPDWWTLRGVAPRSADAPREGGTVPETLVPIGSRLHSGWLYQCEFSGNDARNNRTLVRGETIRKECLLRDRFP
jgi:hypothetical protein